MQEVIDQEMVPRFRQDAYAAGILAGTEATIAALTDAGGGGLWDRIRNSRIVQVGMVEVDLNAMGETVMAALTVLENGRFLQEFSFFAPSTFTGAIIGAMIMVALRLINGREEGNGYGAGSSGGGGASGSW